MSLDETSFDKRSDAGYFLKKPAPQPTPPPSPKRGRFIDLSDLALVDRNGRLSIGTKEEYEREIKAKAALAEAFMNRAKFAEDVKLTLARLQVLAEDFARKTPSAPTVLAYAVLEHICHSDADDSYEDAEPIGAYADFLQEADHRLFKVLANLLQQEDVYRRLELPTHTARAIDALLVREVLHDRVDYLKALTFQGIEKIFDVKADDNMRRLFMSTFDTREEDSPFDPEIDLEEYTPSGNETISDRIKANLKRILGNRAESIINAAENPDGENPYYTGTFKQLVSNGHLPKNPDEFGDLPGLEEKNNWNREEQAGEEEQGFTKQDKI